METSLFLTLGHDQSGIACDHFFFQSKVVVKFLGINGSFVRKADFTHHCNAFGKNSAMLGNAISRNAIASIVRQ